MDGIFSVNGPLFQFMRRLLDVLKLNFIWLICSLPIVTIGPSTIAMFTITLKMVDDEEGYIIRPFLKAFKENMKNGIPLGLLFLLAAYVLYLDTQLLSTGEHPYIFLGFFIVAVFIFFLAFVYSFALSARYENTLIKTMKNSYDISIRYFARTLSLAVVLFIEFVIFFFNYTMLFFFILLGPACIALTISGYAGYFFKQIEQEEGSVIRKDKPENKDALFKDHPDADKGIAKKAHMNTRNK